MPLLELLLLVADEFLELLFLSTEGFEDELVDLLPLLLVADEFLELVFLSTADFEEEDDLLALLLEAAGDLACFTFEDLSLFLLTEVVVVFLSLSPLDLFTVCASTVKARNNIASMRLKFFMTFSFNDYLLTHIQFLCQRLIRP